MKDQERVTEKRETKKEREKVTDRERRARDKGREKNRHPEREKEIKLNTLILPTECSIVLQHTIPLRQHRTIFNIN